MRKIFNTIEEQAAYADKCIHFGVDPERVAEALGCKYTPPAKQPITLAEHNLHQHLTAMLKASHAARLRRKGWTDEAAARRCGYSSASVMRKAIRKYTKSPAPSAKGNGAGQNYQTHHTTSDQNTQDREVTKC